MSPAATRAAAEAEARRDVDKQQAARAAELVARSTHRPARLALEDLAHGVWVARLLARAPDMPRQVHLAMAARALHDPHWHHAATSKVGHEHDELLRELNDAARAAHAG